MGYQTIRYQIFVTGTALKEGRKLNLPKGEFASLVRELKKLRYWPESSYEFDFEEVEGAYEIKFTMDNRWIRIFVYKDDDAKKMFIVVVLAKKTNRLTDADKILVRSRIARIENEKQFNKKKENAFESITGGRKHE